MHAAVAVAPLHCGLALPITGLLHHVVKWLVGLSYKVDQHEYFSQCSHLQLLFVHTWVLSHIAIIQTVFYYNL